MAQVLVIGSIVRPVFLALPSHFLCTPCLLQRMLLIFLANAPPVICQLLDAQLALNLIPVFISCKPVPHSHSTYERIRHMIITYCAYTYQQLILWPIRNASGLTPPCGYLDCSWYLQLAVFAGCLYAASWFALCSNGYVTLRPTCFSRGEQWQPVVNTKAHTPSPLSTNII